MLPSQVHTIIVIFVMTSASYSTSCLLCAEGVLLENTPEKEKIINLYECFQCILNL